MTETITAISLLWIFVMIYAVAASIDFGAGFWSMIYRNKEDTQATNIANKYLSPFWEVTNVFVVLIVVALFSFFPGASFTLGTVLMIPGSLVVLLLIIRSAFMVYSHSVEKYVNTLRVVSGLTGLLIPALLISVLPVSQGGFITFVNGTEQLQLIRLLTNPHELAYIGLAVSSTLFLSSLLLADFSNASGEWNAFQVYRRDALGLGPITLVMAFLTVITMQKEAAWLYSNLLDYKYWLLASVVCLFVGYFALLGGGNKRLLLPFPRIAVVSVIVQYLLASYAYGAAHLPYIVYPSVTIASGFTHSNTFWALFWSYLVGFAILAPCFLYFWKLFMKDQRYVKQK